VGRPLVKGTEKHRAIGSRVRFERLNRDIPRAAVASHLGIDVSVYGRIEIGQVALTLEKADKIADFIGVPITRLGVKLSPTEAVQLRNLILNERKRKRAA
jgi:transcriptional regulator with XRE-family HTH domain